MQQRVSTSREGPISRRSGAETTVVRNSRFIGHFTAISLRIRIRTLHLLGGGAGTALDLAVAEKKVVPPAYPSTRSD